MGFLDNLENAWDENLSLESSAIPQNDAMGREKFWEDLGRPSDEPTSLAVKLFSEMCCTNCSCKNE